MSELKLTDEMPKSGRFIMIWEGENGMFSTTYQWIGGVLHFDGGEEGWVETENREYKNGYYQFAYVVKK